MSLRPLNDRIIVKRIESATKTASGIVIPDSAKEKPDQGQVLSIGPGRLNDQGKRVEIDLRIGDRVLFGKYAGQTVNINDEELLVLREDDVIAIVNL